MTASAAARRSGSRRTAKPDTPSRSTPSTPAPGSSPSGNPGTPASPRPTTESPGRPSTTNPGGAATPPPRRSTSGRGGPNASVPGPNQGSANTASTIDESIKRGESLVIRPYAR